MCFDVKSNNWIKCQELFLITKILILCNNSNEYLKQDINNIMNNITLNCNCYLNKNIENIKDENIIANLNIYSKHYVILKLQDKINKYIKEIILNPCKLNNKEINRILIQIFSNQDYGKIKIIEILTKIINNEEIICEDLYFILNVLRIIFNNNNFVKQELINIYENSQLYCNCEL